ncbi:hypothetical protein HYT56_02355 [Candidatus Woesearchaeota archaeon]|nr:hypothetical protein [Candidatus Woesearchaeota archaeon]
MKEPFIKAFTESEIGKRGQSTIFIIAGIAIIIVVGLILFFSSDKIQTGERITTSQVEPIKEYVDGCIQEELEDKMPRLKQFAGYFDLVYGFIDRDINYLDHFKQDAEIELMLENSIKERLKNYCSLDVFKDNFNLDSNPENIFVDVIIDDFNVNTVVQYPITISKADLEVDLVEFKNLFENDFGILARAAHGLINFGDCDNYNLPYEFSSNDVHMYIGSECEVNLWTVKNGKGGSPLRFKFVKNE